LKIRQQLSPGQRRLYFVASIATWLILWVVLTLPVLPANPLSGVAATVADAPELAGEEEGMLGDTPSTPPVDAPAPTGPRPLVPASILPSPMAVVAALGVLHTEQALVRSAFVSFARITFAFLLAALVAIPLGIYMGTFPPIKAAIEPLTGPLRYLPVSAITGLFILIFGIDESMKIAFLFVGIVVYLLPICIESVENVDQVYLDTAATLGAKRWQIINRVIVPGAWPGIFEACRVIYGIGWTYVILAELINAKYGLGYLITISYKRGHIDWAYALVFVVLLLGIGTNELFIQAGKRMFAWREA
jgi:NitT/TauT family transport system permease protein